MSEPIRAQLLVLGGGPGGYVAAIRAGQLGLGTVLVTDDEPGGTCLIRGCIPSKALIHAATTFDDMVRTARGSVIGISLGAPPTLELARTVQWKDGIVRRLSGGVAALLARAKVRVVRGWATFSDAKTCTVATAEGGVRISAEHVVLAAGSVPAALPELPFGGAVISSTEALSLDEVPGHLVVVGAGYIGLELGIAFRKMGASVAIVEAQDRILPLYDRQLTDPVRRWLDEAGVAVHLGATALGLEPAEDGQALAVATGGGTIRLRADKVLVTIGRRPRTDGWGLEAMAVDLDGRFVKVDDQCRTAMRGVFAIGDLVGEPMLAHKASAQGEMVAEIVAGRRRRFEPAAIPAVCFTEPEIVSVGLAPGEAEARGIDAATGVFPLSANGRALTMEAGRDGGFVRVVARRDDHRILGVQAVGARVSELSGEFVHAIEMGALVEDVAGTIHAHPTLSEAFGEAALRSLGRAIHM